MSENVDAFLAATAAINRGDVEGLLRFAAEDAVFPPLRSAVEGGYRGHDGLRRFLADNAQTFEVFQLDYHDLRELGDQLVAVGTVHIRGRGSGEETDISTAGVASFRGGKMTRWEDFGDREKALKAVGLEG
jgi:ketosteroid isomerase-like protein